MAKIQARGASTLGMLGVLFVGLKLTGFINWSWWWVTAPFWGGFALILAILACAGLVWGGVSLLGKIKKMPKVGSR